MAEATQRDKSENFSERLEELRRDVSSLAETISEMTGTAKANGHGVGAKAERLAGRSRKAVHMAMAKGKAAISGVESTVSANPLASVAVAFGLGVLLGRLIRR